MRYENDSNLRSPDRGTDLPDLIRARGVTITVIRPEVVSKRLLEPNNPVELLRVDADHLPKPCIEGGILYDYDKRETDDTGSVCLGGAIEFLPPQDPSQYSGWQQYLRDKVAEELGRQGFDQFQLEHHQSTLYAPINGKYATRFSFIENTGTYEVHMELDTLKDIAGSHITNSDVLAKFEDSIPAVSKNLPPDAPYEIVNQFVHHWAIVLSSIKRSLGPKEVRGGMTPLAIIVPEKIDTDDSNIDATADTPTSPEGTELDPATHEVPKLKFKDLGGVTAVKQQLEAVSYAFLHPAAARRYNIETFPGFLLYGPGGTGKTSIATAFANEINAKMRAFKSTDIIDKYIGESAKLLQKIFDDAKKTTTPLVLFFDEFDSLAPKGDSGSGEHTQIKNVLKIELEIIANNHPNIIVAAATNKMPSDFDEALLRAGGRMKAISVPIPTDSERAEIWEVLVANSVTKTSEITVESLDASLSPVYAKTLDLKKFTDETDGYTGADIKQILANARMEAFVHFVKEGEHIPITSETVLRHIRAYQKP